MEEERFYVALEGHVCGVGHFELKKIIFDELNKYDKLEVVHIIPSFKMYQSLDDIENNYNCLSKAVMRCDFSKKILFTVNSMFTPAIGMEIVKPPNHGVLHQYHKLKLQQGFENNCLPNAIIYLRCSEKRCTRYCLEKYPNLNQVYDNWFVDSNPKCKELYKDTLFRIPPKVIPISSSSSSCVEHNNLEELVEKVRKAIFVAWNNYSTKYQQINIKYYDIYDLKTSMQYE